MSDQTYSKLSPTQQLAINKLKLLLRLKRPLGKWQQQSRNSKHRYNVLKQWLHTEGTYIHDMTVMRDKIKAPLQSSDLVSKQQSQKVLFPGIQSMIELSNTMLSYIQQTIDNWHPITTMIGQNIKYFHKFFIIYREYCNNYAKGQTLMTKIKAQSKVIAINQNVQKNHNLDIESFIIKPVQRPTKYQLLLRDYLKKLPKGHADYKHVEIAMQLYHRVNQQNNEAMHQQQRNQTMINLDKKFGGIISSRSGRQYLTQLNCKLNEQDCLLYAFNDLLILTKVDKLGRQQSLKRVAMDGSSFLTYKKDNKYYQNLYFLCGCTQSLHLTLPNQAEGNYFYSSIHQIIQDLYRKEEQRRTRFRQRQSKRKQQAKFRVSQWYQEQCLKVQFKPKMKITVIGSAKQSDVLFWIQFAMIPPFKLKQHVMVTYKKLVQIKQYLRKKYRQIHLPDIQKSPQNFGIYQTYKNSTKIIQYRAQIVQQFLNIFFRNQQMHQEWKGIAIMLGVSISLYQLAISEHYFCNCSLCVQAPQNPTLAQIMSILQKVHHTAVSIRWQIQHQQQAVAAPNRHSYFSVQAGQVVVQKQLCSTFVFKLMKNLSQFSNKQQIVTFRERMVLLQSVLGSINYALLQPQFHSIGTPLTIRLYLMTIKEEYIDITLKSDKYVRQILQQISKKNALGNVLDWGIFLLHNQKLIHIGNDQKLFQFTAKLGIQVEVVKGDQQDDQYQGWNIVFKWGEQLFKPKKGRLFFKKYVYFEPELQLKWCEQHKERYSFLVNSLFGRIKYQKLTFPRNQTIKLCALYLAMTQFNKLKKLSTITIQQLRALLHQKYEQLITSHDFQQKLFKYIKQHDEQLSALKNQRNAIELLYNKTLNLLQGNLDWTTTYHPCKVYNNKNEDALIGVNHKQIEIRQLPGRHIQVTIPLEELKYKATTFSLFFYLQEMTLRFDSQQSWNVKELIDIYLAYRGIFVDQVAVPMQKSQ